MYQLKELFDIFYIDKSKDDVITPITKQIDSALEDINWGIEYLKENHIHE